MNMNKFKKALPFLLVILFVASLVIFTINRGFKFSDYQSYIKVDVRGDQDVNIFVDRLEDTTGLIEIDRSNKTAYYQHIEKSVVEENLKTIKTEYPEVVTNVQTVFPAVSKQDKVINVLLSGLAIIILFMGYSFVVKTRFFSWTRKEYIKYYGFYLLDNALSIGLLAGAISLLSLVYKINDYILYSIFFLIFFKTLIFWFKLLQENLHEMKTAYIENFKNDYKKLFTISFIVVVLVGAGMGVRSVLPLALILVSIIISALCDYGFLTFNISRLNRKTFNQDKPVKKVKTKEVIQPAALVKKYVPNPKLKKKNKKK